MACLLGGGGPQVGEVTRPSILSLILIDHVYNNDHLHVKGSKSVCNPTYFYLFLFQKGYLNSAV